CPNCKVQLRIPDSAAGGSVKCPKCGTLTEVPAAGVEPEPPAEEILSVLPVVSAAPPSRLVPEEKDELAEPELERERAERRRGWEGDRGEPVGRRRRWEEDEDFYESRGQRQRYGRDREDYPPGPNTGLQIALGVAALAVGAIGLLISLTPIIG